MGTRRRRATRKSPAAWFGPSSRLRGGHRPAYGQGCIQSWRPFGQPKEKAILR